jgi:hypothetical protein
VCELAEGSPGDLLNDEMKQIEVPLRVNERRPEWLHSGYIVDERTNCSFGTNCSPYC